MSQPIRFDQRFFLHVFIGFSITSIIVTSILVYHVSLVSQGYRKYKEKLREISGEDRPLEHNIWSRDPMVMESLAHVRGRRAYSTSKVQLTQINFNDSCFGFVWSKFHLEQVVKYKVEIVNMKNLNESTKTSELGGQTSQFSLCNLTKSTSFLVILTGFGPNTGSKESTTGVMWTTHNVPPSPPPPKIVSVTTTTITITIPEIRLSEGPLSSIEVRLKEHQSPKKEVKDGSPWDVSVKRKKRQTDLDLPARQNIIVPWVEFPHTLSEKVNVLSHSVMKEKGGSKENVSISLIDLGDSVMTGERVKKVKRKGGKVKEYSERRMGPEVYIRFLESNTMKSAKPEKYKTGVKSNFQILFFNLKVKGWKVAKKEGNLKETPSTASEINSRKVKTLARFQMADRKEKGLNDLPNVRRKPKSSHNNLSKLGSDKLSYITLDNNSTLQVNAGSWNVKPELFGVFFTPSGVVEDGILLQLLKQDVDAILDEFTNWDDVKMTSDDWEPVTSHPICKTCKDKFKLKSEYIIIGLTEGKKQQKTSKLTKSSFRRGMKIGHHKERKLRQILKQRRIKRNVFSYWSPDGDSRQSEIKEAEDKLEIDPYQTIEIIPVDGRESEVKTGYGYFITDHYGRRYPYFNDTRLEENLRRYVRFQEGRDFIIHGKSFMNVTNLTSNDLDVLRLRMEQVMRISRGRRHKLFNDLFEDFLFWAKDRKKRQMSNQGIAPDAAKLGLPPGFPVARNHNGTSQNITIGNYHTYGKVPNPALKPGTQYEELETITKDNVLMRSEMLLTETRSLWQLRALFNLVIIAVMSTVVDVTKHSWSSINVTTQEESARMMSPIFVILVGAFLAVCVFVLLLACFVLWCSNRQRKAKPDEEKFEDFRLQFPTNRGGAFYRGSVQPPSYPAMAPGVLYPPQGFSYNPSFVPSVTQPIYTSTTTSSSNDIASDDGIEEGEDFEDKRAGGDDNSSNDENNKEMDDDITLPNYIGKLQKPETHWNKTYDVSSKRFVM